jgi:hypothetical protein
MAEAECQCEKPDVPYPEGVFDPLFDGTCRRCGALINFDTSENGLISKPERGGQGNEHEGAGCISEG